MTRDTEKMAALEASKGLYNLALNLANPTNVAAMQATLSILEAGDNASIFRLPEEALVKSSEAIKQLMDLPKAVQAYQDNLFKAC
jgi:hypothetical protein